VIPAGGGVTEHIGDLFVAKNPFLFRQRTSGPTGNQYCFVEGPYSGQLSARGETIELRNAAGTLLKSTTWTPAPLATQNQLRITELNFAPAGPTAAESLALPGVVEGDFEYIELMNIGATPLALGGAYFDKGVTFTFSAGYTLAAGARCLLVSNHAAFQLRYGTGLNSLIAGQYEGQLDNNGETLQVLDSCRGIDPGVPLRVDVVPAERRRRTLAGGSRCCRTMAETTTNPRTGRSVAMPAVHLERVIQTSPTSTRAGAWEHFTSAEMPTLLFPNLPAALMEDPDGDGLKNIGEYAYGRAAKVPDHNTVPNATVVNDAGTDYLAVTFKRRHKRSISHTSSKQRAI
jgi:hypothetical protein